MVKGVVSALYVKLLLKINVCSAVQHLIQLSTQ